MCVKYEYEMLMRSKQKESSFCVYATPLMGAINDKWLVDDQVDFPVARGVN